MVLPDGSRAPSRAAPPGVPLPAGIYQQTPTAACALDAAAPITGGLGAETTNKRVPGIYLCIACFIADIFAVTASSCADTQRPEPFLVPIFLSMHNPLRLSYEPVRWEVPVTLQGFSFIRWCLRLFTSMVGAFIANPLSL